MSEDVVTRLRRQCEMVATGRAHTREHFPLGEPDTFVGRIPTDDFYVAVDGIVGDLPAILDRLEKAEAVCVLMNTMSVQPNTYVIKALAAWKEVRDAS